jgi:hypothetical protein
MNHAAGPLALSYVRSRGWRGITIRTGREAQPRTLRHAVTLRRQSQTSAYFLMCEVILVGDGTGVVQRPRKAVQFGLRQG